MENTAVVVQGSEAADEDSEWVKVTRECASLTPSPTPVVTSTPTATPVAQPTAVPGTPVAPPSTGGGPFSPGAGTALWTMLFVGAALALLTMCVLALGASKRRIE